MIIVSKSAAPPLLVLCLETADVPGQIVSRESR